MKKQDDLFVMILGSIVLIILFGIGGFLGYTQYQKWSADINRADYQLEQITQLKRIADVLERIEKK